jgi:hypothetical protein
MIDFDLAANAFLNNVREKVLAPSNEEFSRGLSDKTPYHTIVVDAGKPSKFLRIWNQSYKGTGLSAWAFIALADGESKGLGRWRRGDIFKPDSWKKPAKHARGNIFEPGNNGCCNVTSTHGPAYLRG